MLYMVTFTINIPPMLAYIPAPWILWGSNYYDYDCYDYCDHCDDNYELFFLLLFAR